MPSRKESELAMRIASCMEDGFSFISHSDSNERRIYHGICRSFPGTSTKHSIADLRAHTDLRISF
jgi:hypothetical protein